MANFLDYLKKYKQPVSSTDSFGQALLKSLTGGLEKNRELEMQKELMGAQLGQQKELAQFQQSLKTTEPKEPKSTFNEEEKLRGEFMKGNTEFGKVRDSYARIKEVANTPTAAGDLALIFNYMKMLDPGSTVREGEFANAQNSAGIPQRVVGLYNSIINGQRLSQEQRSDFLKTSDRLFKSQKGIYDNWKNQYTTLSESYGLDPAKIVIDVDLADGGTPATPAAPSGPLTQEDYEFTANKYNMTVDEVKQKLGVK